MVTNNIYLTKVLHHLRRIIENDTQNVATKYLTKKILTVIVLPNIDAKISSVPTRMLLIYKTTVRGSI